MNSLFKVTVYGGKAYYVVAKSYAGACSLFREMVETDKDTSTEFYEIKTVEHITCEIHFYPEAKAVLHNPTKRLILPTTKPKEVKK